MTQVFDRNGNRLDAGNLQDYPILSSGGPPQATKVNRDGTSGALYDAVYDPNVPVSGGYLPGTWATRGPVPSAVGVAGLKDRSQLGQGEYLAFGETPPQTPAEQAITRVAQAVALPRPDPRGYAPSPAVITVRGGTTVAPTRVDPRQSVRFGRVTTQIPGMVTGPKPVAVTAPRPAIMGGRKVAAGQPLNVTRNIDRFLSQRGDSTNFASEGQRANAFMDALF